MNIFILANSSWNIYNFRMDLIQALNKKNKIYILAPEDSYTQFFKDKKNVTFLKVKIKNNFKYIFYDLTYVFKLMFYIIKFKPKFILSFTIKPNIYCGLLSKFFRYKQIANISGLGSSMINKNILTIFIVLLYKIAFSNIHHLFFQNKYDQRFFLTKKIIKNKKNFNVLPGSGINTDKYLFSSDFPNNFNFIFIGRLIKDKGIYELIESIKIIKKKYSYVNFGILGNFDLNNPSSISQIKFYEYVKSNLFTYYGSDNKIEKYIKNSKAVILPSYREGTSRVLLESLLIGRPIIVSNVPGCKELTNYGKNGLIFKKKNINSLVKAIERFLQISDIEYISMANNGNKFVKKFYSVDLIIKEYSKIIF
jgi:galacturonosyltransferase